MDALTDRSGWWPAVEYPHLVDPGRVAHLHSAYVDGVGYVLRADLLGGASATLVGAWPTEQDAQRRITSLTKEASAGGGSGRRADGCRGAPVGQAPRFRPAARATGEPGAR